MRYILYYYYYQRSFDSMDIYKTVFLDPPFLLLVVYMIRPYIAPVIYISHYCCTLSSRSACQSHSILWCWMASAVELILYKPFSLLFLHIEATNRSVLCTFIYKLIFFCEIYKKRDRPRSTNAEKNYFNQ